MTYITIYHPEWLWISSAPSFLPTMQLYVLSCCSRCNAFSCFPPCGWIMIINGAVGGVCRALFIKTLVIFICCPWLDPPFTPGLWWPDGFLHEIQISVGSNTGSRVMFLCNYNDVCVTTYYCPTKCLWELRWQMMLNASYSMKDTQWTENIAFRVCQWQMDEDSCWFHTFLMKVYTVF